MERQDSVVTVGRGDNFVQAWHDQAGDNPGPAAVESRTPTGGVWLLGVKGSNDFLIKSSLLTIVRDARIGG